MKVILLKDVKGLGVAGDLVNAKAGHARNYLIPRELAVEATSKNLKQWKKEAKEREAKEAAEREEALELKERIDSSVVNMKVKAGEGGRLFGSITSSDIADALEKQYGISVDRRKIVLKENIKEAGESIIDIRVYPEIIGKLRVNISTE